MIEILAPHKIQFLPQSFWLSHPNDLAHCPEKPAELVVKAVCRWHTSWPNKIHPGQFCEKELAACPLPGSRDSAAYLANHFIMHYAVNNNIISYSKYQKTTIYLYIKFTEPLVCPSDFLGKEMWNYVVQSSRLQESAFCMHQTLWRKVVECLTNFSHSWCIGHQNAVHDVRTAGPLVSGEACHRHEWSCKHPSTPQASLTSTSRLTMSSGVCLKD